MSTRIPYIKLLTRVTISKITKKITHKEQFFKGRKNRIKRQSNFGASKPESKQATASGQAKSNKTR